MISSVSLSSLIRRKKELTRVEVNQIVDIIFERLLTMLYPDCQLVFRFASMQSWSYLSRWRWWDMRNQSQLDDIWNISHLFLGTELYLTINPDSVCRFNPCKYTTCMTSTPAKCVVNTKCQPVFLNAFGKIMSCKGKSNPHTRWYCTGSPGFSNAPTSWRSFLKKGFSPATQSACRVHVRNVAEEDGYSWYLITLTICTVCLSSIVKFSSYLQPNLLKCAY